MNVKNPTWAGNECDPALLLAMNQKLVFLALI
jgi:hypothetical protein